VFVCSFSYPVLDGHALFYIVVICSLSVSTKFLHMVEYKMCVLDFSTALSKTFLILRRNKRDIKVPRSSCKVPFIPVRF
jgi:hypothetical protein